MPVIYCTVNMFEYNQTVYVVNDDKTTHPVAKVPLNSLGNFISKYCAEHNITEVHLFGYPEFTQDVKNKANEANVKKYGNHTLNIILEGAGNE